MQPNNSTHASHWSARWRNLIEKIDIFHTPEQVQEHLGRMREAETPQVLAFVNAHAMNSAAKSSVFFDALAGADCLLRDGSGMASLYKMLRQAPGLNLNGTDLIPKIIRDFDGQTIALYGTQEPYLSQCNTTVEKTLAPTSNLHLANGFLPTPDYLALAKAQHPSLIVLGMGMPRQEQVAMELRQHLQGPCLIVCGGAIIDFLGNKVSRAPNWMRHLGLEWLYRLALEPRRLFKRYVLGNPQFLAKAVLFKRATDTLPHTNKQ